MRSTAITRFARPSLVSRYASPADGSGPGPSTPPTGSSRGAGSRRPRKAPTGVYTSEVGLAAASLLPAVPLLRRILRVHRLMPLEMKSVGDAYVKDEFRRHKAVDNPLQVVGFLSQWKQYLDGLETQTSSALGFRGKQLDSDQFEKLNDDQLYQLHELMTVAKEVYDPKKAQAQPPGGQQAVHDAVEEALQRSREGKGGEGEGGDNGTGRT